MKKKLKQPKIRHSYQGKGFQTRKKKRQSYSKQFLRELFYSMLRIRIIEEEIESRYHQDQMKTPIHLVIGQEATSVGACAALQIKDQLWSTHRTHGNYLAKGGDLKAMISEMHCKINGCVGSRGGSMHLIDKKVGMAGTSAIVAGIVPIATGAALAAQIRNSDEINLVFLGDASTEEGAVHESLNFAAVKKLPIVYFCENNFYSVCTPLGPRQPANVEIWKRVSGYGIHSVLVDGTNVLDVYEATVQAIEQIRKGNGPVFIEARVCRYRAHGGAGDDSKTGYRDLAEPIEWEKKADPIRSFKEYLISLGFLKEKDLLQMEEKIRVEINEAFEHALSSPEPVEANLYSYVYSA